MNAEICRKCGEEKTYERVGDIEYYACYQCVRDQPKTDRDLIVNLALEVAILKRRLVEVERQTRANEADILTSYEEFTEFRLADTGGDVTDIVATLIRAVSRISSDHQFEGCYHPIDYIEIESEEWKWIVEKIHEISRISNKSKEERTSKLRYRGGCV